MRLPYRRIRIGVGNGIAVVAVLVSLASLFRDCAQDRKVTRLQVTTTAMAYKPHLSVYGSPRLEAYPFNPRLISASQSDTGRVACNLRMRCLVSFLNDGNAPARLLALAAIDTVSGLPILRTRLTARDLRRSITFVPSSDFYGVREIQPSDTTTILFERSVGHTNGGYLVLHLLALYQNDAGQVFDTYYWARLRIKDVHVPARVVPDGDAVTADYTFRRNDVFQVVDFNSSSIIYNPSEAKDILDAFAKAS